MDLDHFKKVNDSTGHAAGDQLLQIVAQRLRASVKDGDTVARLAGDEFTVILRSIGTPEAARDIAMRIIDTLQQPVNIAGRDHRVCASIGVTMFPDDGTTIEELMRNADLAMYQAKEGGRSREVFYSRTMEPSQSGTRENGLLRALRRREFVLHYQPQYDVRDSSLVGLEALVRWQPPREALRYPGEFIPAAEESGLIVELGAWVLETACQQMAQWREQGIAPRRMALNVSVQQLRHAGLRALRAAHAGARAAAARNSSSWRSPSRCSPTRTRANRCARSPRPACDCRSTTSAPAIRRWATCANIRCRRSRSTARSSTAWRSAPRPRRSPAR